MNFYDEDDIRRIQKQMIPVLTDKQASISSNNLMPHYTNTVFNEPQTVFLAKGYKLSKDRYATVKGAEYNYSDRLYQWDYKASEKATEGAKEAVKDTNSALYFETYLRLYFDKPKLELIHIMAGVNVGNGYPYRIYGYFPEGATK